MKKQRLDMIKATVKAKQGHLSSSFSIVEVLNVLYKNIMKFNPKEPDSSNNDVCIVSKGHAGLAMYALLLDLGIISDETFFSFSSYNSILGEHPDRNKIPGIMVSTGSLGHGLPCGVGLANGFIAQNKTNNVYVIIGDGEANEGSIWESALIAERLNLNNLTCIVDDNHSESYSPYLIEKFKAFGWETIEVKNGNNIIELQQALTPKHCKPLAVISNTKKGYGSQLMMNAPEDWHHKVPNQEEFDILMGELS